MSGHRRFMRGREFYLQQAKLLFELAATSSDQAVAALLVERANEYLLLAQEAPSVRQVIGLPPDVQQQPTQQQQQKTKDDET